MAEPNSIHIPDKYKDAPTPQSVDSNGWQTKIASDVRRMPDVLVDQGKALLGKWQTAFPRENTWVQDQIGLPSLIVRIDATEKNGELLPYEVEERPGGIGLSYQTSEVFRDRLDTLRTEWPEFGVVVSTDPRRKGNDDDKWTNIVNSDTSGLVLVRAEPEETEYHHLEPQSVSSLTQKGYKGYGVEMGLWEEVSNAEDLSWEAPFVAKPLSGSKTKDVYVWIPKDQFKDFTPPGSKSPKGVHTRTKISNAVDASDGMYIQPFHPPMVTEDPDHRYEIYRVFYGYDLKEGEWTFLGGFTNARNSLIVHGARDTLFHVVE